MTARLQSEVTRGSTFKSVIVGGQWNVSQRSIWNNNTANLAIDNDASTCYMSGYENGAWWFVDIGQERVVDSIIISGWFR